MLDTAQPAEATGGVAAGPNHRQTAPLATSLKIIMAQGNCIAAREIRFHLKHDDGLVAGSAVPCTFSHSNFAGSPRRFVLVSSTESSVMPSHGAIGSQSKVPTSACWPLPEIFWNVIALSWIEVLPVAKQNHRIARLQHFHNCNMAIYIARWQQKRYV